MIVRIQLTDDVDVDKMMFTLYVYTRYATLLENLTINDHLAACATPGCVAIE